MQDISSLAWARQSELKRLRFFGLDWLRFGMAMLIAAYHAAIYFPVSEMAWIRDTGYFATSVFFVLSGFILTHVYGEKIRIKAISFREFLGKRVAGFYGAHVIGMVVVIIIYAARYTSGSVHLEQEMKGLTEGEMASYFIQSVFLLQAWNDGVIWLNGPAWSVSALFFFYIVFYLLAPTLVITRRPGLWLAGAWAAAMVAPATDYALGANLHLDEILHTNPAVRVYEFIAGMAAYVFFLKHRIEKLTSLRFILAALGLAGFGAAKYLTDLSHDWYWFVHNGLLLPAQISLIYGFALFRFKKAAWLQRAGSVVGRAALSIFITHWAMMMLLTPIFVRSSKFLIERGLVSGGWGLTGEVPLPVWLFPVYVLVLGLIGLVLQQYLFAPLQNKLTPYFVGSERRLGVSR